MTKAATLFYLKRLGDFNDSVLFTKEKRDSFEWLLIHSEVISLGDIRCLHKSYSDRRIIQTQFGIMNSDLAPKSQLKNEGVLEVVERSGRDSEFREHCLKNYAENFLSSWSSPQNLRLMEMFKLEPFLDLQGSSILQIRSKSAIVSTAVLFDFENSYRQKVRHIGWIWIDSKIDSGLRKTVHQSFVSYLSGLRYAQFQAGILSGNVRSQKFFSKIGFEPLCVYIQAL